MASGDGTTFRFEIQGAKGLARALRQYPKISVPILNGAFEATAAVFAKHTTREVVPWRTGNLLQSFRHKTGNLQARWFPTAKYAPYVEFGTGIYGPKGAPIRPTSKRVLSWVNVSGGGGQYVTSSSGRRYYKAGGAKTSDRIFVRSVKGMRARPYMQSILDRSKGDIMKLFQQAQDRINAAIAKQVSFD